MQKLTWAAVLLSFLLGCAAHSLTHAVPTQERCLSREEVDELHARVAALEARLDSHAVALRYFQSALGLHREE